MVEAENFFGEYTRMSPRELNKELKQIFDFIPPNIEKTVVDMESFTELEASMRTLWDSFERRRQSEMYARFKNRLAMMLTFASITNSFREVIMKSFESQFVSKRVDFEKNNSLFDNDWSDSGGIFDQERAKEIEKTWYIEAMRRELRYRVRSRSLDEEEEKLSRRIFGQPLGQWRQEFIDYYGEEP